MFPAMLSDPIAALATPPGRSAIAVVRVSGRGALEVAARVVRDFRSDRPRATTLAVFHADGEALDRGLYTVYPAPHSYTGEDLVELSCHGGQVAPARTNPPRSTPPAPGRPRPANSRGALFSTASSTWCRRRRSAT